MESKPISSKDYSALKIPPKILNLTKSWSITYDWYGINSDTLSNSLAIKSFDTVLKKINDATDSKIESFQDKLKRQLNSWMKQNWIDPNSKGLPK